MYDIRIVVYCGINFVKHIFQTKLFIDLNENRAFSIVQYSTSQIFKTKEKAQYIRDKSKENKRNIK